MTDTASTPPPRVPNVSAGARSGLLGEVIGADAITAYEENERLAAEGHPVTDMPLPENPIEQPDGTPLPEPGAIVVPAGDLNDRIAWVAEPDEKADRAARADVVYMHERDSYGDDFTDEMDASLSARLTEAVYGTPPVEVPDDLTTVDDLTAWAKDPDDADLQAARARTVIAQEHTTRNGEGREGVRKTLMDAMWALVPEDERPAATEG